MMDGKQRAGEGRATEVGPGKGGPRKGVTRRRRRKGEIWIGDKMGRIKETE